MGARCLECGSDIVGMHICPVSGLPLRQAAFRTTVHIGVVAEKRRVLIAKVGRRYTEEIDELIAAVRYEKSGPDERRIRETDGGNRE
jgi:hypothetical protein